MPVLHLDSVLFHRIGDIRKEVMTIPASKIEQIKELESEALARISNPQKHSAHPFWQPELFMYKGENNLAQGKNWRDYLGLGCPTEIYFSGTFV
jgi:hypothetical protein